MKKITKIEKDCFYMWIEKTNNSKNRFNLKEILIGDSIGKSLKETGLVKFKKFFERDLKKQRTVAYRLEKRFKKDKDSKWFIISESAITKSKIQGCKLFEEITIFSHQDFVKTNNRKPLRKKHYYYIVTF